MVRLGKETNQSPQEVLDKAETFFGPDNVGLELRQRNAQSVAFQGGGGHVIVSVSESGKRVSVDIESREWDYQAQQFLSEI